MSFSLFDDLIKVFDIAASVKKFSEEMHPEGTTINKDFVRSVNIGGGEVTLLISFHNLPPKEIINALNNLQIFSNDLLHEEIPTIITRKQS